MLLFLFLSFIKTNFYSAVFYCPEAFGVFPDDQQCDKFYQCEGGVVKEQLCPGNKACLELK